MSYRRSIYGQQVTTLLLSAINELNARAAYSPEDSDAKLRAESLRGALMLLYPTARRCDAQWRAGGKFSRSFRFNFKLPILCAVFLSMFSCAMEHDADREPDFEKARLATAEAWQNEYGTISDECLQRSKEVTVGFVDYDSLQGICWSTPEKPVSACRIAHVHGDYTDTFFYFPDDRTASQIESSAIHEYIHLFRWCENGVSDNNHSCYECWEENSGNQSIETKANNNL